MATFLWSGEEAVVSHRGAAAIWRLEGIDTGWVELTVTRPRQGPRGIILHYSRHLPRCDLTKLARLPVTEVSRTLIDLGAVVAEELVEAALDDALRRRLTSIPRLRWRLAELGVKGRQGVGVLRRILDERDPARRPPESLLESRILKLISDSRLPRPISQYEIRDNGRILARLDLAYPQEQIAIEADGYRYHSGKAAWEKDLRRRNLLTGRGWQVLHVTWDDMVRRPSQIVQDVQRLLQQPRSF